MLAIFRMRMVMHPACAEVSDVCQQDQCYGREQQPNLVLQEKLLGNEESRSNIEQCKGLIAVVVFFESVPKRIRADHQGQSDHSGLKQGVVYDVDPEQGQ